jgi:hypothetical protein
MSGNRTGSCTGPDRFHREPAEPVRFPTVSSTLLLGLFELITGGLKNSLWIQTPPSYEAGRQHSSLMEDIFWEHLFIVLISSSDCGDFNVSDKHTGVYGVRYKVSQQKFVTLDRRFTGIMLAAASLAVSC